MDKTIQSGRGLTLTALNESLLVVEQFLNDNYLFRRNELNGKLEFATIKTDAQGHPIEEEPLYRSLTQEALNSIVIRAKREQVCEKGSPKQDIMEYVHSEEVPQYNPIRQYLDSLPEWDGHNHVATLFNRLPGVSTEQAAFLAIWLRSTVAHWLQMDTLHGNEVVPVLIGAQGCGKTTFLRRLLPSHLRQYYLDHLNLSNKFDKEMALTNNLLVNLDELDAIRPSQHPMLKQTLSKSKVNGRPIFGCTQEDRLRYASFVATTNNPHPLTDATGSRRYLCLTIAKRQLIDNSGVIDYEQLYAQVLYELRELNAPYWFNNDEVARIQQLNMGYMEEKDLVKLIECCFRKPADNETCKPMNSTEMLEVIKNQYPALKIDQSTRIHLGLAMKELEYERKERSHVAYYKVVPLLAA
jgi:GTPase SAR1 family protein